jgi:threonine dehydrogenase-like Zn-dependent dehydrogenase
VWSVWLEQAGPWHLNPFEKRGVPRMKMGRPIRRDIPLPGSKWVQVRNLALLRGTVGSSAHVALPIPRRRYLGREVVGVVQEIGPEVTLVRVGDRVVLQHEAQASCATLGLHPPCHPCARGDVEICEHRTLPWDGLGAGWSDTMIVHESQIYPVPSPLSDDQSMLLHSAGIAIRAILQRLPEPGSELLIIGGGAMGQLALSALRAIAPGTRVTIATNYKHEGDVATQRNVNSLISAHVSELLQQGAEKTNAQIFLRGGNRYILGGFDTVFVCQGDHASLDAALRLVRGGGAVILLVPPSQRSLALDTESLWSDEVSLICIASPGTEALPEDMAESVGARSSTIALAARLMMKQRFDIEGIITHRQQYRTIPQALHMAGSPSHSASIRVALTFTN